MIDKDCFPSEKRWVRFGETHVFGIPLPIVARASRPPFGSDCRAGSPKGFPPNGHRVYRKKQFDRPPTQPLLPVQEHASDYTTIVDRCLEEISFANIPFHTCHSLRCNHAALSACFGIGRDLWGGRLARRLVSALEDRLLPVFLRGLFTHPDRARVKGTDRVREVHKCKQ
jgi:hypothetical protein